MALPFPQIRAMRRMAESLMFRPCTITRNGALLSPQPTMSDGTPLRCAIDDDRDHPVPGADATQTMRRVLVTLPWQTPVLAGDRITADSVVYGVSEPQTDETDSSETRCYAYALWPLDAQGNPGSPLYLRPNCVVSVSRLDGTSGPQNLDAELKTPDQRFTPQGGEQETYLLFAPALIGQIHNSDSITISSYGGYSVNLGPFEVNNPRPAGDGGMVTLKVGITGFTL